MQNTIIEEILKHKIIVIIRGVEREKLIPLVQALYDGGIRLVELTFCADGHIDDEYSAENIRILAQEFKGRMHVGAGTVLNEKQVELAFEQAQKERDDLSERTRQGLQIAKLNGKQLGRAKGTVVVTKKSDESKKKILKYSKAFGGDLSDKDLIKLLGIDKNTYYKYKKELKSKMAG